jgi:uncharacterized delta-60 repeat protein
MPGRTTTRLQKLALALAMISLSLSSTSQVRAQFLLDDFDPNASDSVWVVVVQPDGKILIGGDFRTLSPNGGMPVARNCIARLNPDGTLDTAFNPNANGFAVWSIALQADGRMLVGGDFEAIGGQTRNNIARLDATTGLADSFNPDANDDVWAITVQPDGKILAGGYFERIGGQTRRIIARLDPTSGLPDSFNPNAFGSGVYAITLQTDGRILVGGPFLTMGGQTRHYIARLDATTGLADSFNPDATNWVQSIVVQTDGKILVSGLFTGENSIGGQARNRIARLDPITGLADSFNPDANGWVYSIAVQPDSQILAGGYFTSIGGQTRNHIARLDATTGAADSFNPNANSPQPQLTTVHSVAVQPDGQILAGGYFDTLAPDGGPTGTRHNIARLKAKPATLGNISTRLDVRTGDNAMIGGFIITGTEPKTVIMRGIGPSLPMSGVLADPNIEVHGPSGQVLGINDNWNDAATRQQIIDSGLAPANALESALWGIILPGPYTVVVRGNNDTTGIGLFEVYDLDQAADSKLGNVSTRGMVGTNDNVMIAGTIIIGIPPARILVRAVGPSLANLGVPNVLGDPTLELYNGNGGLVGTNNNWRDDQESEIIGTGLPPSNDLESAIVKDLAPGGYTAIVRGSNNTTGVALVEMYSLD